MLSVNTPCPFLLPDSLEPSSVMIRALRALPGPYPGIPFGLAPDAEGRAAWNLRARCCHQLLEQIASGLAELSDSPHV